MPEREEEILKKEERKLRDFIVDRYIITTQHRMMIVLAVAGSTLIAGSVSSIILDLLPRWAEIATGVGGLVTGPGAIREIPVTRSWMENARERVKIQEEKLITLKENQETTL